MKKTKYKTRRQDNTYVGAISSILCLFCCIIYGVDSKIDDLYIFCLLVLMGILCVFWFIYSITYNTKRQIFKKKGECILGYIVGAEEELTGRGLNTYYLFISFYDGCEKIKYTEGYVGNPNHYLKSRRCHIYKYKDKYIEADFISAEKSLNSCILDIPISKYQHNSKKKYV